MNSRNVNLPNALTVTRMLLVPVIVGLVLRGNYTIALWFFLFASISDGLDGYIARRFDMRTRLGAILDPLADKFLIIAAVVALFIMELLPLWLVMMIVIRDIVITAGAIAWHFTRGPLEMAPSIISKANTILQVGMIFLVLGSQGGMVDAGDWLSPLFVIVFLTSLVSGVQYVLVWGKKARGGNRLH